MPCSYAHDYCAGRMLALLSSKDAALIGNERKLLSVGAQGPDVFFYHKVLPLKTTGHYRHFARKLHTQNVGESLKSMLGGVKSAAEPFTKKCVAYFAGYLTHYALDCSAHPYVFNRAGSGPGHTRFESDMDTALLKLQNKDMSRTYKALLRMPAKEDRVVAGLLLSRAAACFGGETPPPGECADAIRDMYRAQRLILDPHGLKRGLVHALGKPIGAEDLFSAAILPNKPDISLDSLNLKRAPWREPWAGGTVSDERFVELLERAAVDAAEIVRIAAKYMRGEASESETLARIGARSFHTGRDWRETLEFVETGTVYKKDKAGQPKEFRLPNSNGNQ